MIPIRLTISGFLSYGETAELDFSSFDLACISGSNGAGKSSLLDAMTWALFGQARRRDDALIHSHAKAAEVVLEFQYEANVYRIQRTRPRDKTGLLEFQIRDADGSWRALTEKSVRDTELRIQRTLRLDYETFINASFFLQGKADQFAQQRPGDRKRILSSILGLEVWESYREGAAEKRKTLETDLAGIDSRLAEINAELGEESARRARLKELEAGLEQHSRMRQSAETALDSLRRLEASLGEQQRLVESLAGQLEASRRRMEATANKTSELKLEQALLQDQLASEAEVKATYAAWQAARHELETWEGVAASFRQVESRRAQPQMIIAKERAALEQECNQLEERQAEAAALEEQKSALEAELKAARREEEQAKAQYAAWQEARQETERWEKVAVHFRQLETQKAGPSLAVEKERSALQQERNSLAVLQRQAAEQETQKAALARDLLTSHARLEELQARIEKRPLLEAEQTELQGQRTDARAENVHLKTLMDELDERIKTLQVVEGALCPTCGQPLSTHDRLHLVEHLREEGREKGDRFRANKSLIENSETRQKELARELESLRTLEKTEFQAQNRRAAGLEERIKQMDSALAVWQKNGALRLAELERILKEDDFGLSYRKELERIDGQMQKLGYDAAAHESARRAEEEGRSSGEQLKEVSTRLAALAERHKQALSGLEAWEKSGKRRLAQVQRILREEDFAKVARQELEKVDAELKVLGYDAAAHDAVRRREQEGRGSEDSLRRVEAARAALAPLERQLTSLEAQVRQEEADVQSQEQAWQRADAKYQADKAALPDVDAAERNLDDLREQENVQSMQVGAARQAVEILKTQKKRQSELNARREDVTLKIARYRQLERAFSKDGVPALLIEQALPEIEAHANDILDRLSGGSMSVRFETQRDYKDKLRDDKKETLDILISDAAGTREYELFSGGEAFRINFAIRLALSRVLAQRAGARLQTLVIDEGFGSQDAEGRQRLVEAINLVRPDFAKVLVITHLEELKDAFPARIEVEKTPEGSHVRVV